MGSAILDSWHFKKVHCQGTNTNNWAIWPSMDHVMLKLSQKKKSKAKFLSRTVYHTLEKKTMSQHLAQALLTVSCLDCFYKTAVPEARTIGL